MAGKKRHNIINDHKVCTICEENKHVSLYHSNGATIRGWCKNCDIQKRKGRQQRWADRKNKTVNRDPVKESARNAVREAVRKGKLIKPTHCPNCKKETERKHMHGHHYNGYENKLDIEWLCRWCHAREHTE